MKTTLLVSLSFIITLCSILWSITHYKQGKIDRLHRCNPALLDVSAVSNCYGKLRVVLLGDSRIQQWGKPDFGPQVEIINFGVSGATSSEILCGVAEAFAQRKVDWFVVQVGINDLVAASMQSQGRTRKNAQTTVGEFKQNREETISYWCTNYCIDFGSANFSRCSQVFFMGRRD